MNLVITKSLLTLLWIGSILSAPALFAQASVFPTSEQHPIEIDGQWEEWPHESWIDKETGWECQLQANDSTLFLGIRIDDHQAQQQIMMCGLSCWVGKKPKIPKGRGIVFPLGVPEELRPHDSQTLLWYLRELEGNIASQVSMLEGMELINVYGQGERTWGQPQRESGLRAALGVDEEERLIYEIAIPMALIEPVQQSNGSFRIWLETGQLGRPKDVYGDQATAISGGAASNPTRQGGESLRMIQARQDRYRAYASPIRVSLKKLKLE